MTHRDDDDRTRARPSAEDETGARGGDETRDADALPGAPGTRKNPLGDTDQHSKVPSQ
jgi:hypothetical protein